MPAGTAPASRRPGNTRPGRGGGDVDPFDQTAARREHARELRAEDRRYQSAYEAGRAGGPPDDGWDTPTRQAYDAGVDERNTPTPAGGASRRPARPAPARRRRDGAPTTGAWAHPAFDTVAGGGASAATVIAGALGYAVAVNYIRGGWPGVKAWLAAKFTNTPAGSSSRTSTSTAPTSPYGSVPGINALPPLNNLPNISNLPGEIPGIQSLPPDIGQLPSQIGSIGLPVKPPTALRAQ